MSCTPSTLLYCRSKNCQGKVTVSLHTPFSYYIKVAEYNRDAFAVEPECGRAEAGEQLTITITKLDGQQRHNYIYVLIVESWAAPRSLMPASESATQMSSAHSHSTTSMRSARSASATQVSSRPPCTAFERTSLPLSDAERQLMSMVTATLIDTDEVRRRWEAQETMRAALRAIGADTNVLGSWPGYKMHRVELMTM